MKNLIYVILWLGSFSFPAVADQIPAELLEKNYLKWKSFEIHSYQLTVADQSCWCLHAMGYGPIKNYIREDKIIKSVYVGERRDGYRKGVKVKNESSLEMNVEDVFEQARAVVNNRKASLYTITYNEMYGFPTLIDYDDPTIEDEQSRLVVSEFIAVLKWQNKMQ